MPVEKAGKDQKSLYGFSHFGYGNTDPLRYYASHLEIMLISTRAYNLEANPNQYNYTNCNDSNVGNIEKYCQLSQVSITGKNTYPAFQTETSNKRRHEKTQVNRN